MGEVVLFIYIIFLQLLFYIPSLASEGQFCESSPEFTDVITKGTRMFQ